MKTVLLILFAGTALLLHPAASARAAQNAETNPVPLSMQLLARIREGPKPDLSVRTTNGEPVALFMDSIAGESRAEPKFAVIKPFDTITTEGSKGLLVVPWNLLQYVPHLSQIQVRATVKTLQGAPLLSADALPGELPGAWQTRILAYFRQTEEAAANVPADLQTTRLPQVGRDEAQRMGWAYVVAAVVIALIVTISLFVSRYWRRRQINLAKPRGSGM